MSCAAVGVPPPRTCQMRVTPAPRRVPQGTTVFARPRCIHRVPTCEVVARGVAVRGVCSAVQLLQCYLPSTTLMCVGVIVSPMAQRPPTTNMNGCCTIGSLSDVQHIRLGELWPVVLRTGCRLAFPTMMILAIFKAFDSSHCSLSCYAGGCYVRWRDVQERARMCIHSSSRNQNQNRRGERCVTRETLCCCSWSPTRCATQRWWRRRGCGRSAFLRPQHARGDEAVREVRTQGNVHVVPFEYLGAVLPIILP